VEAVTVSGGAADATSAKTAADTARNNAGAAQTAANNAQTTEAANAAKTAADNAKAAANAAKAAAIAAKTAAESKSLTDTKTSAISIAQEALTIAASAVTIADEAIALGGPTVAAAQTAKADAGVATTAANSAKTAAEAPGATASAASAAKTAATDAKTKATAAKTAAETAKAGNVTAAEAKCKTPVLMKFTAKVEPNAAVPLTGPTPPNVYWTIDSTGPNKEFIWIPGTDKSGGNNNDALTYCGKIGKFLILYNNATKDRNIQYKILGVEKTNANTYYKFNVEKVGATTGFTKGNIKDGQDIFIRTSETQIVSQGPAAASSTFVNACTDSKSSTSANCKPVCIPTDASGNIIYKEGTSVPNRIMSSKNQWLANYYEYKPIRGIGGDGSIQYLPMDPAKTFVGPGTDCTEPCPPQDAGGIRPKYCKPPDPNYGKKGATGAAGGCPIGCIKVEDPTDPRNKSVCKFNKMKGYTCGATCDFAAGSECKKTLDCGNCVGADYITTFPIGWSKTVTRNIEQTYTSDQCKEKCKKPTTETCLNFLQLEQNGSYLENKCYKIGANDNKVICKPISKVTPNGLIAGYDGCNVCKKDTGLYGFFEYKKQWNDILKQWDFVNLKEIPNPSTSWFEGETNYDRGVAGGGGGGGGGRRAGTGYGGAGSGGSGGGGGGGGTNLRGSKPSGYQEDKDTRGARDSREMGKLQSSNNSKSLSISSASQIAQRQQQSANASALKMSLDKMNNEYNDLVEHVKWNKMQMDKAEKDCTEMNVKLKRAYRDYAAAEAKSIKVDATIKEKKDTEAANTLMYTIKQKTREICENYGILKAKYMKSTNEMNTLKNKIDDLRKKYDAANSAIGGGGSGIGSAIGSALSPIINIFFGDDVNRDCSGQLGCGNGIDYSFPSPFDSSKGGMFTPQPYYSGINF
jgi:hypothetical protein